MADGDAIIMAQDLARELEPGVGISSGANFLGARIIRSELGKDAVVVTVFAGDNKKHFGANLRKPEPARAGYLAPDIQLLGFHVFERTG